MKRIQWFKSASQGSDLAGPIGALMGGLLVTSILVVGCSKEKSQTASSNIQAPVTQGAPNLGIPVNSTSNPVASTVTPTAKPKKVARKRPPVVTYADQAYGVSFQYPRKYTLKSGAKSDELDESQTVAMDFMQPGGVNVVGVQLPQGTYPGTDLKAAFFNVSVNKELKPEECGQFSMPDSSGAEKSDFQPEKVSLSGMDFQEVEDISRVDARWDDAKYYHVYENGACYEFALGMTTDGGGTDDGPTPVDREDVFRRLEKILATVKIKQEVAAQGPANVTPAVSTEPTVTLHASSVDTGSKAATPTEAPSAPSTAQGAINDGSNQ